MYVPLDVNFPDDDKVEAVSLEAVGLYCIGLCLAKRLMSDGRLTRRSLIKHGGTDEVIDELVSSGLLCPASVRADASAASDDVQIIAWLDHNDAAEAVEGRRAADARRKRLSRAKRPPNVRADAADASVDVRPVEVEVEIDTEVEVETTPSNVVPVPDSAPAVPRRYPASFQGWWDAYPRKVGKQDAARAYRDAARNYGHEGLADALAAHAASWAQWPASDRQFIPHPATWLRQGRYEDPPPPVQRTAGKTTKSDGTRAKLAAALERMEGHQPLTIEATAS